LSKIQNNLDNIVNKIIILPNEYEMLGKEKKIFFEVYEKDKSTNPISYIKKEYKEKIKNINEKNNTETQYNNENLNIMLKKIITPDEYFLLSDSNKSKYEIYQCDYKKFPNRVVPKNYIKIN
jgi:gas vesicle protein